MLLKCKWSHRQTGFPFLTLSGNILKLLSPHSLQVWTGPGNLWCKLNLNTPLSWPHLHQPILISSYTTKERELHTTQSLQTPSTKHTWHFLLTFLTHPPPPAPWVMEKNITSSLAFLSFSTSFWSLSALSMASSACSCRILIFFLTASMLVGPLIF